MSTTEVPKRTAYLVLGMHRSGTSAVTQLLALAGASLPENVMAGDEHNAKGYFEPWKIAILNDGRLRAAGAAGTMSSPSRSSPCPAPTNASGRAGRRPCSRRNTAPCPFRC